MTQFSTEPITILRGHLEEIYTALNAAAGFHAADDLRSEYKNVAGVHKPSKLTTVLERSRDRAAGYLQEPNGLSEE